MNKKHVPNVDQRRLNFLVKRDKVNSDSDAKNVLKLLYERIFITNGIAKNIGSSYGLKKVTVFVNSVIYRVTVILKLNVLKGIGLINCLQRYRDYEKSSILSTMELIFIKTVV